MISTTINLDSFHDTEQNEKFYLAIGENRQGKFKIMINDFNIENVDKIKGHVLGYKIDKNVDKDYVICYAYSNYFTPLKLNEEIREYNLTLHDDGFSFERV
jgi:DNA-dependent RNA polymerase auxiliary subunit epsilon